MITANCYINNVSWLRSICGCPDSKTGSGRGNGTKFSTIGKYRKNMDKTESRVLILEHEERVCRVLGRIIKQMGFEVLAVNKYMNFKSSYLEFKPDIMLLSLEIPNVDHHELLHYLITQDSRATIILMSNMDEDEISSFEKLCLLAGLNMGGILRKPIDVESVKLKLEGLVRKNHVRPLKKNYQFRKSSREWPVTVRELITGSESGLAGV
jgi:DNA-binding response OmpR family regulator